MSKFVQDRLNRYSTLLATWTAFCIVLLVLAGSVLAFLSRFIEGTWGILLLLVELPVLLATALASPRIAHHARVALARPRQPRARQARITLVAIAATLVVTLSLPFVAPPVVISDRPLPGKPLVIAHRGASHFAPENTIAAGQAAVSLDCVGWEIDVQVSLDGEFFLLHDDTFERTTNVREIFPGKARTDASWFTMAEIHQLDAGSWFTDGDPFWTIATGVVPQAVADGYRSEPVPSLAAAIAFSLTHGLVLDVDFKRPVADHPHAATARAALIDMIAASGLGKQAWIATSSPAAANNTRMTWPVDVTTFLASDHELVNAGLEISNTRLLEYLEHDIPVVVYTVDDIFTFSTLWVHGVTYVKSSRPWIFNGLDAPVMHAGTAVHVFSWMAIHGAGALAACIVLARARAFRHRHPGLAREFIRPGT